MRMDEQQLRHLEQEAESPDVRSAVAASTQLTKVLTGRSKRAPGEDADRATAAMLTHARNLTRLTRYYREFDALPLLVTYGRQAVKQLRRLARQGTDAAALLAQTLADLGYGYAQLGKLGQATRANREATGLYQGLAQYDRPRYLGDLAGTYYTAAMILERRNQYREALRHSEWCSDLFREAAELNPAENAVPYEMALQALRGIVQDVGTQQDGIRIASKHG